MKVYVVAHKKFDCPKQKIYVPIQVGQKENFLEIRDNCGDNIAEKNENYCELTALYWVWKNRDDDVVGIVHYRRYFTVNFFSKRVLNERDIRHLLKKYDILLPRPNCMWNKTVRMQFSEKHYLKDLLACGDIIKEIYPSYFIYFEKMLEKQYFYQYNMVITDKVIYDEYMTWLFTILFELEKRTNFSGYDSYNKRLFGFVSERLLDVWLEYNKKYTVKELFYINTEQSDIWRIMRNVYGVVKRKLLNYCLGE